MACRKEHVLYCFDVLYSHLNGTEHADPLFANDEYPLFVTWKLADDSLRGCIGSFSQLPLHFGLREYALIAALRDTRFEPIDKDELEELSCGVSLLTNFEPADGHFDWEIGKHGIQIDFGHPGDSSRGGRADYSATFLPEVALEQDWDHMETITNLIRKSGYRGRIDEKLLLSLRVTRYQSHKTTIDFAEFWRWKRTNQNELN